MAVQPLQWTWYHCTAVGSLTAERDKTHTGNTPCSLYTPPLLHSELICWRVFINNRMMPKVFLKLENICTISVWKQMSKVCRTGLDLQVEGQAMQSTAVLKIVNRKSDKHMHWKHTMLVFSTFYHYFPATTKIHKPMHRVNTECLQCNLPLRIQHMLEVYHA